MGTAEPDHSLNGQSPRSDVSIRCREMGTAEPWGPSFSPPVPVSIRCREMGTAEPVIAHTPCQPLAKFLFAVARWGQRNRTRWTVKSGRDSSFYSLSRDGDSGKPTGLTGEVRMTSDMFLFAVARWGQRNKHSQQFQDAKRDEVSIRCREMGTAEPVPRERDPAASRVSIRCREMGTAELLHPHTPPTWQTGFYSLSRDGDSGTVIIAVVAIVAATVSIRCREMGRAERHNQGRVGQTDDRVSIRCREMGTAEQGKR